MSRESSLQSGKADEARRVIELCKTEDGFRASTQLYPELWLRDLVFSEAALLDMGYSHTVRRHFETFLRWQRRDGQLPTVITSGWRRLLNQRYHFWTSDTEILFLLGTKRYADSTGDSGFLGEHREQLESCLRFVEGRRSKAGLIPGMDWRDAMINYRNKFLLSNQMLLVDMYDVLGKLKASETLRRAVRETFYSESHGYFADCVWWEGDAQRTELRLDLLGNSLAILNKTASGKQGHEIGIRFAGGRTQFGYRNISPPCETKRLAAFGSPNMVNAFVRNGAVLRNRKEHYQNSAIWPFVEAKVASAFSSLGMTEEARIASSLLSGHAGLNEWYNPLTGEPCGSKGQLWTAAAVIEQIPAGRRLERTT